MLIINSLGILLIALIVWWFWLYKSKETAVSDDQITVIVENGIYQPSRIKLPAGQSVSICFLRKDPGPCSATLVIPDAEISQELPLNKAMLVELPAMEKGEHPFHCQMQMYKGKFLVE